MLEGGAGHVWMPSRGCRVPEGSDDRLAGKERVMARSGRTESVLGHRVSKGGDDIMERSILLTTITC